MGVAFMRVYSDFLINSTFRSPDEFNPDWYWNEKCFSAEEVENIKKLKKLYAFKRASTVGKNSKNTDGNVRESEIFWVESNPDTSWIYDRIMYHVAEANKKWGFDLYGSEKIQYTRYSGPEVLKLKDRLKIRSHRDVENKNSGHYDWHVDFGKHQPNRKVSVVVQLSDNSDYNGGVLFTQTGSGEIQHSKSIGCCVIFPSFTLHKVEPVTKGIRESLVCWAHGPSFK